ncbi:hypothetical protein GCM10022224_035980 [Nonomuraea antimicrobica]|uniref:Fusaric acid resistance protein-like n=1 Tax=Nonomuraea antimicrobica TaxID=561173 RepID=A0ABP7BVE1_9ACTN
MRGSPVGVLLPAGFVYAIGACAVAALAFAETADRVVLVAVEVGVFGAWAGHYLAAPVTGVMAWCFTTGFLVHAEGELTFEAADLERLVTFTVAALVGCAFAHVFRPRGPRRPSRSRGATRRAPVLVGHLHGPGGVAHEEP